MQAAQNYIYIVFAVLYVIYSIIKANKKAQQGNIPQDKNPQRTPEVRPPAAAPLPGPGDEIKEMFEEILGKTPEIKIPEKQVPKSTSQPVSLKPQSAKIVTHAQNIKAAPSHNLSKTKEKAKPLVSGKMEMPEQSSAEPVSIAEELSVDFDIRQAILYSEVLKRPSY